MTRNHPPVRRRGYNSAVSNCQHCERPAYVRGLCIAHYQRWREYGNALEPSHKRVRGTCSECSEPSRAKGLCQPHYDKLRRTGVLGGPLPRSMTRLERYLAFVDQRGPDDCWPWTGHRSEKNYGQYADGKRGSMPAHRYGFGQFKRALEPGEIVDHTCHNRDPECEGGNTCEHRACQNPAHLEAVPTSAENTSRAVERFEPEVRWELATSIGAIPGAAGYNVALNRFKTHCKWGHELTPENSYGRKGRRQCKICARLAARGVHPRQLGLYPPLFPAA